MKVLYAIQGTGNGHLSRAQDVIPALLKHNISLDILVSGIQADIKLPYPIKYQLQGLSFIFGKKGGVDVWKTYYRANSMRLQKEIKSIPVDNYDLVINDFEPVTAWACKLKGKPCYSFSHQTAVLSSWAPKPKKKDRIGKWILKNYAPTSHQFGLHFKAYESTIYTPIIRNDIRSASISKGEHYTVYLPSYSDEKLLKFLSKMKNTTWEVFSKYTTYAFYNKNIQIKPITDEAFVKSMASSKGVLCGAGFETPAESLFMQKKLLVVPMKGQYEQQCNAAALSDMGVPIIKSLKKKYLDKVKHWLDTDTIVPVNYPDVTDDIVSKLLEESLVIC
ncbi:glycosyltransferase family protein [Maribacter ulvicola]|uniref:Glycosyl transferase n=1 Tax=Maribacter ulvicola TaxID=228959 RepID=A0A1N6QMD2_9FLAO|nr:glycosyltransferase family protein [Maribacter ulvicola]SIQ17749.1 conserved hypothetical protein [Maribacter ulvicola]